MLKVVVFLLILRAGFNYAILKEHICQLSDEVRMFIEYITKLNTLKINLQTFGTSCLALPGMDCSAQPMVPITEEDFFELASYYDSIHPMITVGIEVSIDVARQICTSMCMKIADIADELTMSRVTYYNRKWWIYEVIVENSTLKT